MTTILQVNDIDYSKMTRDFNVWVNSDALDWIESSCWIANATYEKYGVEESIRTQVRVPA